MQYHHHDYVISFSDLQFITILAVLLIERLQVIWFLFLGTVLCFGSVSRQISKNMVFATTYRLDSLESILTIDFTKRLYMADSFDVLIRV